MDDQRAAGHARGLRARSPSGGKRWLTYHGRWINGAETLEISASPDVAEANDLGDGTDLNLSLTGAG